MKRLFFIASLILSIAAPASFAQSGSALLIPSDARALSMGGVSLRPTADKLDVKAYYGSWAPKTAANTVVGGEVFFRASERFALSVEGRTFLDKPYEISSAQGMVKGEFRPSDLIVGLGASYAVTDFLSIDLKARMLSSSIGEKAKGNAFCGDLRVGYEQEKFSVGLSGRNLGSKLSYDGKNAYALPMLAALDGSVRPVDGLTIAAEADYLFSGALMAGLGVEYTIAEIVSLRGGFHYGDAAKAIPTYASLGLGVQFAGVHLDAAFLLASKTLGNSLMVGLGYSF